MEERIVSEDKKMPSNTDLKVEVIIPTLNEEGTIVKLIRDIRDQIFTLGVSILIIDGGSTDNTLNLCRNQDVKLILQKGRGKGNAMREALEHTEADIIVFIDADNTYAPSDLGSLLEPLINDKADMVVGSRLIGKRQKGAISSFNMIGNKIFNRAINFAMNSHVTDSLSGYRAMFTHVFKDLVLFSDNFEIEVEMTVEALAKKYRVVEKPINYNTRQGTRSRLNPLHDGSRIARALLFILMNVHPLKFFALIGLVFFIGGLYPGYFVLYEKFTTGVIASIPAAIFSSLLFMTSVVLLAVGLLSELVVRSRRRVEHLLSKMR
jgi:dolichol-phosphate hexosyltransferase